MYYWGNESRECVEKMISRWRCWRPERLTSYSIPKIRIIIDDTQSDIWYQEYRYSSPFLSTRQCKGTEHIQLLSEIWSTTMETPGANCMYIVCTWNCVLLLVLYNSITSSNAGQQSFVSTSSFIYIISLHNKPKSKSKQYLASHPTCS